MGLGRGRRSRARPHGLRAPVAVRRRASGQRGARPEGELRPAIDRGPSELLKRAVRRDHDADGTAREQRDDRQEPEQPEGNADDVVADLGAHARPRRRLPAGARLARARPPRHQTCMITGSTIGRRFVRSYRNELRLWWIASLRADASAKCGPVWAWARPSRTRCFASSSRSLASCSGTKPLVVMSGPATTAPVCWSIVTTTRNTPSLPMETRSRMTDWLTSPTPRPST